MQGAVPPSLRNHILDTLMECGKRLARGCCYGALFAGIAGLAAHKGTAGRPDAASGQRRLHAQNSRTACDCREGGQGDSAVVHGGDIGWHRGARAEHLDKVKCAQREA